MSSLKKICLVGAHGTGKSKICKTILTLGDIIVQNHRIRSVFIPEQFSEIVKHNPGFTKQTQNITLATYGKQLYLENLYTAQRKNILCDRSVLDTFVYYNYCNKDNIMSQTINNLFMSARNLAQTYSKIYLIEPSDREIEDDGFRLTDKTQQLEIHKLFLEYFKDFSNVEIVNQEDAHKEKFILQVANEFIL